MSTQEKDDVPHKAIVTTGWSLFGVLLLGVVVFTIAITTPMIFHQYEDKKLQEAAMATTTATDADTGNIIR